MQGSRGKNTKTSNRFDYSIVQLLAQEKKRKKTTKKEEAARSSFVSASLLFSILECVLIWKKKEICFFYKKKLSAEKYNTLYTLYFFLFLFLIGRKKVERHNYIFWNNHSSVNFLSLFFTSTENFKQEYQWQILASNVFMFVHLLTRNTYFSFNMSLAVGYQF